MKKYRWFLINNSSHLMNEFTSERKLRAYAKNEGLIIKRSCTNEHCFYTISYGYVPANG